jgi:hypothetical protein
MFGRELGEPSIALLLKVLSEASNSDEIPGEYSSDEALGEHVARVLGNLAPGTPWEMKVVSGLLSALDAKWDFTRTAAARSLAKFGSQASVALPRLKAMAESDKYSIARQAAANTILTIQAAMQHLN